MVAAGTLSIPNINILFKLASILRFIDDFSYYCYHVSRYDSKFRMLSAMTRNITNSKWLPEVIEKVYNQYLGEFLVLLHRNNTIPIPSTWTLFGENFDFLENTADMWLCMIPLSVVVFAVIRTLTKMLPCNRLKLLLVRFSLVGSLFVGLFG